MTSSEPETMPEEVYFTNPVIIEPGEKVCIMVMIERCDK